MNVEMRIQRPKLIRNTYCHKLPKYNTPPPFSARSTCNSPNPREYVEVFDAYYMTYCKEIVLKPTNNNYNERFRRIKVKSNSSTGIKGYKSRGTSERFKLIFHQQTHTFIFILYNDCDTPGKDYNSLLIPLGHLDNATLNRHLGHVIYMT